MAELSDECREILDETRRQAEGALASHRREDGSRFSRQVDDLRLAAMESRRKEEGRHTTNKSANYVSTASPALRRRYRERIGQFGRRRTKKRRLRSLARWPLSSQLCREGIWSRRSKFGAVKSRPVQPDRATFAERALDFEADPQAGQSVARRTSGVRRGTSATRRRNCSSSSNTSPDFSTATISASALAGALQLELEVRRVGAVHCAGPPGAQRAAVARDLEQEGMLEAAQALREHRIGAIGKAQRAGEGVVHAGAQRATARRRPTPRSAARVRRKYHSSRSM